MSALLNAGTPKRVRHDEHLDSAVRSPKIRHAAAAAPAVADVESFPIGPIASLPVDVLALVLSHFPLRPRLRCLSFVCRRWRAAAVRSVTSLRVLPEGMSRLDGLLLLFPSVHELELSGCWDPRDVRTIALPAHISSLALLLPLETYSVQLAAPLAYISLTSPDAHAVPLLRLSKDTLVSLNLHTSGDIALGARFGFSNEARMKGRRELSNYLASEHFASLRSISLVTPPSDPHAFATLIPFFAMHSTQLRSLQLDPYLPIAFIDQIAQLPFPCITQISLCAYEVSGATLQAFLAHSPRLQNFKMLCNERAFSAPPPTLASLLHLEINRNTARDPRSFPANLAHLRRVDISLDLWDSKPPLLPAVSTRVSRFEDRPQFQDVWALLCCNAFPNLRRLLLSHVHSGAKSATLQLPRLEMLRVEATADLDTTLATLRLFVRQCPMLREVDFSLPADMLRDYSDLFAFLREAEAAGVERMQVHGMDVALHVTLVDWARRHFWLRLTPQMHSNMVQRPMYYIE